MAQIDLNNGEIVQEFAGTFKKSEDRARQIISVYNRQRRAAGDIAREADLSLTEETEMIRFLDKRAWQTRVPLLPLRKVEDPVVTRVSSPPEKPLERSKQQTRIPLSSLDILQKQEMAVSKSAEAKPHVQLRTTAQKVHKRPRFYSPKKSSIGEITSKDPLVIDIATKFGVQQKQAEICINCYRYKYYGVGDMQKHAGISNKASEIYNYLSSLHIRRDLAKPPVEMFAKSKVYA
ncbi:MAG: hypothetical protein KGH58_03995 [Candidatus Micrarchaeota archaeon]|nr:hypothetical protein [Candidatus Micrarchaeota archaeon]